MAYGWLLAPGAVTLWLAVAGFRAMRALPSWGSVARHVDDVTNEHNLILIAYELSRSAAASLFAKVSIYRGMGLLNPSVCDTICPPRHPVTAGHILKGVLVAVLLGVSAFYLPVRTGGLSGHDDNQGASASADSLTPSQPIAHLDQSSLRRPAREEKKSGNPVIESQSMPLAAQDIPILPGTAGGESAGADRAGGQAGQSSPTQSGGAVSAQNLEGAKGNQKSARYAPQQKKSGIMTAPKEAMDNSSHTAQKGASGLSPNAESDIKAMMAYGGIEELADQDEAYWDREEQRQTSPSGVGQRPQLSDNQMAPNRDLGMSGKPGDKAGDGRGGPGLMKKSRATASSLSASTLPVQVKGRTMPGKSKSYTQSLPLSSIEPRSAVPAEQDGSAKEGDVSLYIPDPRWKSAIGNYFSNLRNTELE
jgi:hypothetical protein